MRERGGSKRGERESERERERERSKERYVGLYWVGASMSLWSH
jgi:hypothetical protein